MMLVVHLVKCILLLPVKQDKGEDSSSIEYD